MVSLSAKFAFEVFYIYYYFQDIAVTLRDFSPHENDKKTRGTNR